MNRKAKWIIGLLTFCNMTLAVLLVLSLKGGLGSGAGSPGVPAEETGGALYEIAEPGGLGVTPPVLFVKNSALDRLENNGQDLLLDGEHWISFTDIQIRPAQNGFSRVVFFYVPVNYFDIAPSSPILIIGREEYVGDCTHIFDSDTYLEEGAFEFLVPEDVDLTGDIEWSIKIRELITRTEVLLRRD